jgi:glycosyltransferase involved in cell wall biosynthesis
MIEGLACQPGTTLAGTWFSQEEIPHLLPRIQELSALVITRVRYATPIASLIAAARAKNVPVWFDCDDFVFDSRYVHFIMQTLAQDARTDHAMDTWFAHIGRIEAVARLCDGGITTNSFLAERMKEIVPGPVAIVPNFMNRLQQEVSDLLLQEKQLRNWKSEAPTLIGYFSGTPSHTHDFALVAPALARLLAKDKGVRLRIVGYLDALGILESHRDRIEFFALHDFVNLQRLIAEVDINLAPLQTNIFTNCKSELKFFEAAAVGTWTLASPTPVFQNAISSPQKGQLVKAQEWDPALADALEIVRSPDLYPSMAVANAKAVRESYGWNRFADAIHSAVFR